MIPWQRIRTALIMLPIAVFAVFFLPLKTFSIVVAIITLIGFWEWTGFVKKISFEYRVIYLALSAALMWFIYANSMPLEFWNGWLMPNSMSDWLSLRDAAFITLMLGAIWWAVAFVLVFTFPKFSQSLVSNILLMAVIGWLLLLPFWIAVTGLRSIGIAVDFARGSGLLLFALCLVWAADTGAFIAGKWLGKHKLAPQVSPKKTWEGVLGGTILASVIAWFAINLLSIPDSQLQGLAVLIVIIVAFSVIGDLTESIFKRLSGNKDSGTILPGHGGVLDRIDGLTAAMPLCILGFAILGIR